MQNQEKTQSAIINYCEGCWLQKFIATNPGGAASDAHECVSLRPVAFAKGQTLVRSGEPASGVYCIKKGKVKAFLTGSKNRQFILRMVGEGELIGLSGIMNNDMYNCSSVAMEHVTTCFIPMADLKKVIENEPVIREKIMKDLYGRLRLMEQRVVNVSKKSVREQLAELLISGSEAVKLNETGENYSKYSLSDLASIMGTNRNYLYKVLADLTDKNVISVQNRRLVVNNMAALSRIARGRDKLALE